jgi:glycosyltransferase involved in cell wall biosynthesis
MSPRHAGPRKTGVLFLSSAEQPGADTFIHMLVMRGLDRSRFDVHVAGPSGGPGTRAFDMIAAIPDLRVRPSDFGPSLFGRSTWSKAARIVGALPTLTSFAALALYVRRHRITVLHSTDRPRDAVACAALGKLTGARSVIHVHLKCADWMSRAVRRAMGQVDALVGVSEFVARSLVQCGYPAPKTHAVLNAIDVDAWDYRLDPAPARHDLGIPDGAPVIACAARLFRGKGQDDVIRALLAIRPEFPDVRLLIIGSDDRQAMSASFTEELKELARDLGLAEHVIFTGHRTDMAALLAASDVFALPSFEEPFGLVFLEALAMKKPVVALNNGGAPEVVEHGRSGLLSPAGDQAALAANLLTLLRNPSLRSAMGEYGRRQVEARFTPARMAQDVERVYATLASPSWSHRGAAQPGTPSTVRHMNGNEY